MTHRFVTPIANLVALVLVPWLCNAAVPDINPALLGGMKWRQIGPFRGGRVVAVSGVPGDPDTWYFGGVAGGVWKSTDVGASWKPMFDDQKIASIGAIAVADSDHNVIYVGTGEACPRGNITYGDGVYKSVDAGRTWKNMGLKDTRQIGALIVHPKNPDIVLVAALGHAFGPHDERGVFEDVAAGCEVGRYHSLIAEPDSMPAELEVSARTAEGEIMGVRHRQFTVEGVQFHPESVLTPDGPAMMHNFLRFGGGERRSD